MVIIELAKMTIMNHNYTALTNFDRFEFAVNGGFVSKAPLERRVAEIAKNESADSFRYHDDQNTLPYRGFFVRAAMDAIENGLASASFHVKTGWYPPRYSKPRSVSERLHNTAEPKRQNGRQWIISTRHAHLVWKQMEQWSRAFMFSCPLRKLSIKGM